MRRVALRTSYIAVTLLAVMAFMFVQRQMDGIAPAPPTAVPSAGAEPKNAGPLPQLPTVLAPEDAQTQPPTATRDTTWDAAPILQSSLDGQPVRSGRPTVHTAKSADFLAPQAEPL